MLRVQCSFLHGPKPLPASKGLRDTRAPGPVRAARASRFAATALRMSHTGEKLLRSSFQRGHPGFLIQNPQHRRIQRLAMLRAQPVAHARRLLATPPRAHTTTRAHESNARFHLCLSWKELPAERGPRKNLKRYGVVAAVFGSIFTTILQSNGTDSVFALDAADTPIR